MSKRIALRAVPVALAFLFASLAIAADDATLRKDLTAVIALQGLPCGEVVNVVVRADSDYVASCKDGNRYRIFLKEGRVVVQKQ
jgi:hypothetical protein